MRDFVTKSTLVNLLYRENQDTPELREYLKTLKFKERTEPPTKTGEYLIRHLVYGWCLYGFTVKDEWGADDHVIDKNGNEYHKVRTWAEPIYEEQDEKNVAGNI
jgi:hypothetical protein